jgi:hypothetical protein
MRLVPQFPSFASTDSTLTAFYFAETSLIGSNPHPHSPRLGGWSSICQVRRQATTARAWRDKITCSCWALTEAKDFPGYRRPHHINVPAASPVNLSLTRLSNSAGG